MDLTLEQEDTDLTPEKSGIMGLSGISESSDQKRGISVKNHNFQMDQLEQGLKKIIRGQESKFKKEKAVLEQRNELLQMELEEFKEREADQKEMYETMITALKGDGKQADENQLKQLKDMFEIQVKELKEEYECQINDLK